jgi:hypothetical protein
VDGRASGARAERAGVPERPDGCPAEAREATAPVASDSVAQVALAANTAQRVAIPAGAPFVNFAARSDGIWVLFGNSTVTAAIGAAGTAGANAALNVGTRRIPDGATHVSLIAEAVVKGSLEFWS